MAFQLVDDALDLEVEADAGKTPFADLREGKLTWPLVIAAEREPGLLEAVRDRLASGRADVDAELVSRVRRTGGVEATRAFAADQARMAGSHLERLPAGPARRALQTVVSTALRRSK
jgi:octaprenyl-diphosphate synthase